ncbi:hypothetical protein [Chitinophaga barathri]|uniref:Integral membrane protein n=1 Tax=Chitinophaga barathri TaxID=1647451 RepID=A0A3N4MHJ2_9BACT|nr:hypothetical protein [Chitinophaga barathri]RPD39560.1 hypothetical protein EG028_18040 [Chitinophaga barathri]
MKYQLRNIPLLKKLLWADFILGGGTALIGLFLYPLLTGFLGLPANVIIIISAVTLAYALLALSLALQKQPPVLPLRILMYANWAWTLVSIGLLICYFKSATPFGAAFLVLQVLVVGMLAWLEGRHFVTAGE